MEWDWDDENAREHFAKHKVRFELAVKVFEDTRAYSEPDPHEDGNRWKTMGLVGDVVLVVVHTEPVDLGGGEEVGRIISAWKADPQERERYAQEAYY